MLSPAVSRYTEPFRQFGADARRLLAAGVLTGAVFALAAIDIVPFLASVGTSTANIAFLISVSSGVAGLGGLGAAYVAGRVGRRLVYTCSATLAATGLAVIATGSGAWLMIGLGLFLTGQQGVWVVEPALLRERSRPGHRDELFAAHFAIVTGTGALAGIAAALLFATIGRANDLPSETYRLLITAMAILALLAAAVGQRFAADHRQSRRARAISAASNATSSRVRPRALFRLLAPWALISLGSGQVIPFLSYFFQIRFQLEPAATNLVFAGIGAAATGAILLQPLLVRKLGRIPSVVAVQGLSIPLLLVLGFGPFGLAVAAAFGRSALMEAGHPIYNLSVMDAVPAALRPLVASLQLLLMAGGVALGSAWFGFLQTTLGFDRGFAVAWISIALAYSVAISLLPWAIRPVARTVDSGLDSAARD